jgi:acyl-CoA synthetase (AMP-forming)/AMP-acid ligase II
MASTQSLAAILEAGSGNDPAVVVGETAQVITFADLGGEALRLARQLSARGVSRGDRVSLVIPSGPDFTRLMLAVNILGATAAPLNPAYTRSEYKFYFGDLQPRFLLLPEGDIAAARQAAMTETEIIDVSDGPDFTGPRREADFEPAQPNDIALLLHTSGTTSRPKQVPLTHANIMASAHTIADFYGLSATDVSYCAMPLFHVHGLVASVFSALLAGGSVVVPRRFTPRAFWRQTRQHAVTWFSAGPTLHQMILDRPDGGGSPAALRFARSCSSALSPALMERIEETFGVPVLEAYGMTEASHQMASNPLPPARRAPGSVGIATGVEIRIVDANGTERRPGEAGEVVIQGPSVMGGYLANPRANEESFFGDWFRTGDRGRFDRQYLRLEGRLKEMILRGGENIAPVEIDDVLKAHPAVADAVSFGVPDEKYGEKVGAAVVLCAEADEGTLASWCGERLASFKVPEVIAIVDAIPRTATGKVQRERVAQAVLGDSA